jgi:hypothetical protein
MEYTDNIKRYVVTASMGQRAYCPTEGMMREVWVSETEGGDMLTCCAYCQRVIQRVTGRAYDEK